MAINLDNAQFRAFQTLANDAKLGQDTLVSVDESGRGKGLLAELTPAFGKCGDW